MKRPNKKQNQKKVIKELAAHFTSELDKQLPLTVLPNGNAVFKGYIIKQTKQGNWGIYTITHKDLIAQFFLKTCALMAAKAYSNTQMTRFHEIKELDNRYWANYCDNVIYKKNIKTAAEFERYVILLNKLEDSEQKTEFYKDEITRMFKWSFV